MKPLHQHIVSLWKAILIFLLILVLFRSLCPKKLTGSTGPVTSAECLLCGPTNTLQGTDTLSFIHITGNSWRLTNIGTTGPDPDWERIPGLKPLDEADQGVHRRFFYFDTQGYGTEGNILIDHTTGLTLATFLLGQPAAADIGSLTTALCPSCLEQVVPAVQEINCFLYDGLTGEIYSIYKVPASFSIRSHQVRMFLRSKKQLAFAIQN